MNVYAYVNGNTANLNDPMGLKPPYHNPLADPAPVLRTRLLASPHLKIRYDYSGSRYQPSKANNRLLLDRLVLALEYIHNHDSGKDKNSTSEKMAYLLHQANFHLTITLCPGVTHAFAQSFSHTRKSGIVHIRWSPNEELIPDVGTYIRNSNTYYGRRLALDRNEFSNAPEILAHEIDHAWHVYKNPTEHRVLKDATTPHFDNSEEKRVINLTENAMRRSRGASPRASHCGKLWAQNSVGFHNLLRCRSEHGSHCARGAV